MKVRIGYVSNSSSTSFRIVGVGDKEKVRELIKEIVDKINSEVCYDPEYWKVEYDGGDVVAFTIHSMEVANNQSIPSEKEMSEFFREHEIVKDADGTIVYLFYKGH